MGKSHSAALRLNELFQKNTNASTGVGVEGMEFWAEERACGNSRGQLKKKWNFQGKGVQEKPMWNFIPWVLVFDLGISKRAVWVDRYTMARKIMYIYTWLWHMGFSLPNPGLLVGGWEPGLILYTLLICLHASVLGDPQQCSFITTEERVGWIGQYSQFHFLFVQRTRGWCEEWVYKSKFCLAI